MEIQTNIEMDINRNPNKNAVRNPNWNHNGQLNRNASETPNANTSRITTEVKIYIQTKIQTERQTVIPKGNSKSAMPIKREIQMEFQRGIQTTIQTTIQTKSQPNPELNSKQKSKANQKGNSERTGEGDIQVKYRNYSKHQGISDLFYGNIDKKHTGRTQYYMLREKDDIKKSPRRAIIWQGKSQSGFPGRFFPKHNSKIVISDAKRVTTRGGARCNAKQSASRREAKCVARVAMRSWGWVLRNKATRRKKFNQLYKNLTKFDHDCWQISCSHN